jgi:hypothetical protein
MRRLRGCALVLTIVLFAGCDTQQEIPLAKVPPAPADFGKHVSTRKIPKGGSPENVQDYNFGTTKK